MFSPEAFPTKTNEGVAHLFAEEMIENCLVEGSVWGKCTHKRGAISASTRTSTALLIVSPRGRWSARRFLYQLRRDKTGKAPACLDSTTVPWTVAPRGMISTLSTTTSWLKVNNSGAPTLVCLLLNGAFVIIRINVSSMTVTWVLGWVLIETGGGTDEESGRSRSGAWDKDETLFATGPSGR
jgi:hypothetical protein